VTLEDPERNLMDKETDSYGRPVEEQYPTDDPWAKATDADKHEAQEGNSHGSRGIPADDYGD
jgi:hypothetical protein